MPYFLVRTIEPDKRKQYLDIMENQLLKGLLEQLVYGRISLSNLMHESETLKSYFMSLGLSIRALSVENNNMYVSDL